MSCRYKIRKYYRTISIIKRRFIILIENKEYIKKKAIKFQLKQMYKSQEKLEEDKRQKNL